MFKALGSSPVLWRGQSDEVTVKLRKMFSPGARERVQRLRALAALEEDPRGVSKPSVTPVPGNLMPSSGFHWHSVCMWYADIYM